MVQHKCHSFFSLQLQRSCHFYAQCPRCASSEYVSVHLCTHGHAGLKIAFMLRRGEMMVQLWSVCPTVYWLGDDTTSFFLMNSLSAVSQTWSALCSPSSNTKQPFLPSVKDRCICYLVKGWFGETAEVDAPQTKNHTPVCQWDECAPFE